MPAAGSVLSILAAVEPLGALIVGLLVLVLVGLVAIAIAVRRISAVQTDPRASLPANAPRSRVPPQRVRWGTSAAATAARMVCPSCRSEFHGMTYCTRDARRLVSPAEIADGAGRVPSSRLSAGLVCTTCRRAFKMGQRQCPHDGNDLIPAVAYRALRPPRRRATEPAGIIARICPTCASKFDLNARFCGHDGGELIVIN